MGIEFRDADIQNGDWVDIDERNKRKNRKKQKSDIDVKASRHIKKPTKVKPGYKKKIQRDVENFKKRERRIQRKK